MNRFYLFRSDITHLESYHKYNNLQDFESNCWDFYLLMALQFLKSNVVDEVIVWRLYKDIQPKDIVFELPNSKKFIQRWIKSLDEVFKHPKPLISFFRGGFKIYCDIVKKDSKFFGLKLYLGASNRIYPRYGGKYDKILVEDESNIKDKSCIPFYKTANPNIFKPIDNKNKYLYDICWPCNFTQIKYKGQEYFINEISKSKALKSIRICHIGNNNDIGKRLCDRYKVNNIIFIGYKDRFGVNDVLNKSKIGLVTSNRLDGCPRISTEIMMSGRPLLLRSSVRILDYYKRMASVVMFNDDGIEDRYMSIVDRYANLEKKSKNYIRSYLDVERICNMNLKLWI